MAQHPAVLDGFLAGGAPEDDPAVALAPLLADATHFEAALDALRRFAAERNPRPEGERTFKPREERAGGDKPFRKPREGGPGGGDKPFRKPREDGERSFKPRAEGERTFKPREERAGGDKPFRKPREDGERSFKPRAEGERSFKPREDRAGGD